MRFSVALAITLLFSAYSYAQAIPVYIDKNGRMRHSGSKEEAKFFGTNYTIPFAHAYRAHQALNISHEEAIRNDVYHFHRLGFNAFRVHVWDVEITDKEGNLLKNEHLRLFDFLLNELKKYDIKILLTPIAFWGNGYPEPDETTPGFSSGVNKRTILRDASKTRAQENYVRQFVQHINPYTRISYANDPDIIAMEINNEPHHSGDPAMVTDYINRLAAAARTSGWKKPVFYNISESPSYAEAVLKSKIEGVSFQWYPTGLVAGRSHKGNYYPNMARYEFPWKNHPAMKNKALMVYEFDAGDLMSAYGFPAMAKSFKNAGFQWATHFAYDPMGIAHANTEYQTHYVNMVFTPSKAISLLIAAKLFRSPVDFSTGNEFQKGPLTINPVKNFSQWNDDTAFYYTETTRDLPKNIETLSHIAGTGSSSIVQYHGTGAYFLDKLADGVWRLEVMPDAVPVKDPFERASLNKTVTAIYHNTHPLSIQLNNLGKDFRMMELNTTAQKKSSAENGNILVKPGAYVLYRKDTDPLTFILPAHRNFYAAQPNFIETTVRHEPPAFINAGTSTQLNFLIASVEKPDSVKVELLIPGRPRKFIKAEENAAFDYNVKLVSSTDDSGPATYRIWAYKNDEISCFPGGHKGNPRNWDYYQHEFYETIILPKTSVVPLFNAQANRNKTIIYQPDWNNGSIKYAVNEQANTELKFLYNDSAEATRFGIEFYCGDIVENFADRNFKQISFEGGHYNLDSITINLIHENGESYGVNFKPTESSISIPLTTFSPNEMILLPRPYPGFQPLFYQHPQVSQLDLNKVRKIQIIGNGQKFRKKEFIINSVVLH